MLNNVDYTNFYYVFFFNFYLKTIDRLNLKLVVFCWYTEF